MNEPTLSHEAWEQVVEAIRMARRELRWKPGKEIEHLQTRKDWGHLPEDATLEDYRVIITAILEDDQAQVFIYHYAGDIYPTVVTDVENARWLVMIALNGIVETAFVVEQPDRYLTKRQFEFFGSLAEVLG